METFRNLFGKSKFVVFFVLLYILNFTGVSDDWPFLGSDDGRRGYSPETISENLALHWVYHSRHNPQPAWSGRDTRMPFDLAYHPVIGNGMVYFGSSADEKIYALDAKTGGEQWTFFTNGPVRFAPLLWKNYVYVVSDDGYLYCLTGKSGKLIWKHRGGPFDSLVLGNGRMISRWPARGAPVISGGVLYYAAGIWPSEGIYLYALEPENGKLIWRNDSSGSIFMPQPHGGSDANSGVSAQGELAVCGDILLVPTGRAVPAAFDQKDGRFLYFHLQKYGSGGGAHGGSRIIAGGEFFFNDGCFFEAKNGALIYEAERESLLSITPENIVLAPPKKDILVLDRKKWHMKMMTMDRRGKTVERETLTTPVQTFSNPSENLCSVAIAENKIFLGSGPFFGSESFLCVKDIMSGKEVFREWLDGPPYGLAISCAKIYVSTDKGSIYCFGEKREEKPVTIEPKPDAESYPEESVYSRAADEILKHANMNYGYCVDLGSGDGALAYALAKKSRLRIYAIEPDLEKANRARLNLDRAGLYGVRVTVLQEEKTIETTLPIYFADLIVSCRSVTKGPEEVNSKAIDHLQRPFGGIACIGKPGLMKKTIRGELGKAGSWTHQYADAANSNCSGDSRITGPLGVLWFADLGFQMPNRHGRGPAPLFKDGILVVEGLHGVLGVNAYNGRIIWNFPIKDLLKPYNQEHLVGTAATNSNMCIGEDIIFLRHENRCLCISLSDGKLMREYGIPGEVGNGNEKWGYIAFYEGLLFGTCLDKEYNVKHLFIESDMKKIFSESKAFFALDAKTGQYKWSYNAKKSIRNNAIAIGNGKVFLIDCEKADEDVLGYEERRGKGKEEKTRAGELFCFDVKTGKTIWKKSEGIYGTLLSLSEKHDVLLMGYQYSQRSFQLPSEKGNRLTAFRTSDGKNLWEEEEKYISHPVIVDNLVYTQPYARDILTGKLKEDFRLDDRAPCGCGNISGSNNLLVYRSGTLGYTDLASDLGTENYGGIRPGCWINAIPAGGLVLMPDATDQCRCSYLIKSSIALAPYGLRPPRFLPEARSFIKPVNVGISSDIKDIQIRFTTDGSEPNTSSKLYSEPFEIKESVLLKAKSFSEIYPPSQVSEAQFFIDPHLLPLENDFWDIYDSPGTEPAKSNWVIKNGIIKETSNIFKSVDGNDPAKERPGSLRIYKKGMDFRDGEIICEIASMDNDTLGVAFRFQDKEHYYLWAMDKQRNYHVLALKNGNEYKALASNKRGYEVGQWQKLRIVLSGSKITVYLGGEKDLEAEDETYQRGAPALYSWGSSGSMFRNILWKP